MKFTYGITTLFLTWMFAPLTFGADIIMHRNATLTVPINSSVGTVLEFPSAVQMTVPSKVFSIKKIITEVDKKSKQAVNLRFFSVKSRSNRSTDTVTFVFPNMRSVKLRFISRPGADKHHLLQFPNRRGRMSWNGNSFLEDEIDLMVAMLRDESGKGFDKSVMDKDLRLSGYKDIEMILVRRFQGKGLLGYVFKIVNTGETPININPAALNFDSPNQASLLQIDHEILQPCHINNSVDPKSNSCMTAIRLVVKGTRDVLPASGKDLPFRVNRG